MCQPLESATALSDNALPALSLPRYVSIDFNYDVPLVASVCVA